MGNGVAAPLETVEIGITTHLGDGQTFVEGDVISFLLSLDQDAWVYLFYRDAKDNVIQIVPARHLSTHFYRKGLFMPFPATQKAFQLKIEAPFGEEQLLVFASDNADIKLSGKPLNNGLRLITESVINLPRLMQQQSSSQYGSATLAITSQSQ